MNKDRLIENLTEQIKEAQLKLGYAKETIRLYSLLFCSIRFNEKRRSLSYSKKV